MYEFGQKDNARATISSVVLTLELGLTKALDTFKPKSPK